MAKKVFKVLESTTWDIQGIGNCEFPEGTFIEAEEATEGPWRTDIPHILRPAGYKEEEEKFAKLFQGQEYEKYYHLDKDRKIVERWRARTKQEEERLSGKKDYNNSSIPRSAFNEPESDCRSG